MAINRTGFETTNYELKIDKDPLAQLIYTFDWSDWLDAGDNISTAEYSVAARRNDPVPLVIENSGVVDNQTYVEVSGGQALKTYIITVLINTDNGLVDRRNFKINVVNRSA